MTSPDPVNILGVNISAINMAEAVRLCDQFLQSGRQGFVCLTGVHGLMEAQSDPEFRNVLNRAVLCLPDGMPTVWIGRLRGHRSMRRVYGPDFMLALCQASVARPYRHFLYGGREGVAQHLAQNLRNRFPQIEIVGTYTPPFRPLREDEEEELCAEIARCRPDVMWIGLSTPKQERFMAKYSGRLETRLMAGVGAAFDIHTGRLADAPQWMKVAGLQWLHRLIQEPRRLWRRYLLNNPKFVVRALAQLIAERHQLRTTAGDGGEVQ